MKYFAARFPKEDSLDVLTFLAFLATKMHQKPHCFSWRRTTILVVSKMLLGNSIFSNSTCFFCCCHNPVPLSFLCQWESPPGLHISFFVLFSTLSLLYVEASQPWIVLTLASHFWLKLKRHHDHERTIFYYLSPASIL